MQKYRLELFHPEQIKFTTDCAKNHPLGELGDCFVRAINVETDIDAHNARQLQHNVYTEPMTIHAVWHFIHNQGKQSVGDNMHRCLGLILVDSLNLETVLFERPVIYTIA